MTAPSTRPLARLGAITVSTVLLAMLAAPAFAHVTANPNEAHSEFFTTRFRVGHGCEGSPTTELRVQIPDGVRGAKPEIVPGWQPEIITGELDEPYDDHGETITQGPVEVAWTGGPLADDNFQEFGLSLRLSEDLDGEVVYFPLVQTCESGEHRWIEIPATVEEWGDLDEPAPYVQVALAPDDNPGDEASDATQNADPAAGPGDGQLASAEQPAGEGTDPLTYAALGIGFLGLLAGGAALATRRRT